MQSHYVRAGRHVFPCRAVIFDKDGTLFDHYRLLAAVQRARETVLGRVAGQAALARWRPLVGVSYHPVRRARWSAASRGLWVDRRGALFEAVFPEEIVLLAGVLAAEGFAWHDARETARRIVEEADRQLQIPDITYPFPGVTTTVRRLAESGLRLALATSDSHKRAEAQLAFVGLADAVRVVVTSERVAHPKPAPDMVLLAARELGVAPADCIVVGDSPLDAAMGRTAGVRATVGVGDAAAGEAADRAAYRAAGEAVGGAANDVAGAVAASPWTCTLPSAAALAVEPAGGGEQSAAPGGPRTLLL